MQNAKIFDNYKGVVLFYLVIAIISFAFTLRVDAINKSEAQTNNNTTYICQL